VRYLIRFIKKNAAGDAQHSDKIISAPAITIGRATDQMLHLRDRRARLEHATIEPRNGDVYIKTGTVAGVSINGRSQRDAKLAIGDIIEVGANIMRVIEPPDGVDFALSFELGDDAGAEHLEQSWTTPTSGVAGWSKRRLSWSLATLVIIVAFALPGLSLLGPGVASVMRGSDLLPDDGWWLAGPVHSGHSSTAAICENCHTSAFQRVPDDACMACHTADRHVAGDSQAVLGETRCASCHLEHNEPPQLVNQHQDLCADCHQNLPDDAGMQDASDFLDAHPDFRVSLLRPVAAGAGEIEWTVEHVDLAEATTADRSNLKFDHRVHLDAEGIITPDGKRVVDCAECHVPEPGGARMLPVSMDEHCSGCHTLTFDPDDPTREVPHGDPAAVVQALVEYYSARLLGADPDAVEQRVRRPGAALTRADRDKAAAEARTKALAVAKDLFERQACTNCHEVSKVDDNAEMPWWVLPVRLTESFFPHARFSHAAHETEVTSCSTCHAATESESANDLLMPDIDTCRDCHGSAFERRNDASQTPSTCIMCHNFHFEAKGNHQ
jgi:FHA domain